MDPFRGLADFILGKMKQSALALWIKLLFSMSFSALVSFLFTCGGALMSGVPSAAAVGAGMVMAALCMVVLFRRSPLTKGLMLVLPAAEAGKEMESNFQTIERT